MIEEAKKLNIPSTCITFDQPLWQKAMGIIKEKNSTNGMSVKWILHINELYSSGLDEAFEEVYFEDKIKHFISGYAVARALRTHWSRVL